MSQRRSCSIGLGLAVGLSAVAFVAAQEIGHATEDISKVAPALQLDETEQVSIIHTIKDTILRQLRDQSGSSQEINAWIALAAGAALMFDGELFFKWVMMGGFGVAAFLLAQNEVVASGLFGSVSSVRQLLGIEAGLVVAYVTYYALDATVLVVGAWFGFFLAHSSQKFLVAHGAEALEENKWLLFAWYSVFTLLFWFLVVTKKHIKLMGVITAFFGGPLVASSICFFLTESAMKGGMGASSPVMGAWVDFFRQIIGTGDVDVGIWADKPPLYEGFSYDRVLGCGIWFVCFVIGSLFHAKVKAAHAKEAAANEQPLLSDFIQVEA